MKEITAYLHFNGKAREAMTFYKDCLGGELLFTTVGETAMSSQLSPEIQKHIMHSVLKKDNLTLYGSDMVRPGGVTIGNHMSLFINCSSEEEINSFYKSLVKDGKPGQPLTQAFWGSIYGDLDDKYGINWMFNFDKDEVINNSH